MKINQLCFNMRECQYTQNAVRTFLNKQLPEWWFRQWGSSCDLPPVRPREGMTFPFCQHANAWNPTQPDRMTLNSKWKYWTAFITECLAWSRSWCMQGMWQYWTEYDMITNKLMSCYLQCCVFNFCVAIALQLSIIFCNHIISKSTCILVCLTSWTPHTFTVWQQWSFCLFKTMW